MNDRLPIADIVVGERRREDYGDIDALAASIREHGLIHPIVVDDRNRLVAGGRRLRACAAIGMASVEVRTLGDLSDEEVRAIELEENLRRKDLTPYERSKNVVALVETAAEVDRSEFRPTVGQKPRGRPAEAGSLRRVAERVGIPAQTIQRARDHVGAVDSYPELAPLPQADALKIATKLDAMPEPERVEARSAVMRSEPNTMASLTDRPPVPTDLPTPRQHATNNPARKWNEALHDIYVRLNSVRDHGGISVTTRKWSAEQKADFVDEVEHLIEVLSGWRDALREDLTHAA